MTSTTPAKTRGLRTYAHTQGTTVNTLATVRLTPDGDTLTLSATGLRSVEKMVRDTHRLRLSTSLNQNLFNAGACGHPKALTAQANISAAHGAHLLIN